MRIFIQAAGLCAVLAFGAAAQKTSDEQQVRDRGRERVEAPSQSPSRGRLGRQASMQAKPITLRGLVVDGSCLNRSTANLKQPPEQGLGMAAAPTGSTATGNTGSANRDSAHGASVDPKIADAERADALEHLVPDVRSRVDDPSCGITGNTRGLAILLDNGRLLNLDEGGNTLVLQRIQDSPQGRAMVSGAGPALKPKVQVKGIIDGDKLDVTQVIKVE